MPASDHGKPFASRILPYTTVLLIVAAAYAGYTFYSRWSSAREAESRAADAKLQADKNVSAALGGNEVVKLLTFTAPSYAKRGEPINLCYGVSNAVSVTVEPHIEDTKPSYLHCMQTVFKKETTYTLTAKDAAGRSVGGSLTVHVQ
jgi:hypothetical protein